MRAQSLLPPLLASLLLAQAALAASWSVEVRRTALRDRPSFLGAVVAPLAYGERGEETGSEGPWTRLKMPAGSEGWVHGSALTEKKIVLRAGNADVKAAADREEIALAGKGFNREVEKAYRAENEAAAYDAVDAMEKRSADDAEVRAFLAEGGLADAEGGKR